jgi:hypothetical protein
MLSLFTWASPLTTRLAAGAQFAQLVEHMQRHGTAYGSALPLPGCPCTVSQSCLNHTRDFDSWFASNLTMSREECLQAKQEPCPHVSWLAAAPLLALLSSS